MLLGAGGVDHLRTGRMTCDQRCQLFPMDKANQQKGQNLMIALFFVICLHVAKKMGPTEWKFINFNVGLRFDINYSVTCSQAVKKNKGQDDIGSNV